MVSGGPKTALVHHPRNVLGPQPSTVLSGKRPQDRLLHLQVIRALEGDRNRVVPRVEVDSLILRQVRVAVCGQPEQAAKRGNGAGGQTRQLAQLVRSGKAQSVNE